MPHTHFINEVKKEIFSVWMNFPHQICIQEERHISLCYEWRDKSGNENIPERYTFTKGYELIDKRHWINTHIYLVSRKNSWICQKHSGWSRTINTKSFFFFIINLTAFERKHLKKTWEITKVFPTFTAIMCNYFIQRVNY